MAATIEVPVSPVRLQHRRFPVSARTGLGPARDDLGTADLTARARDGDKRAWDALVEQYAPLIWSICRKYRLGPADADDVARSVWLHLVDHLDKIREPAALARWLATTTRRECGRLVRAAHRPHAALYALDAENMADVQTAAPSPAPADSHPMAHRRLRRVMWGDLRYGETGPHQGVGGVGCCGSGEQAPEGVSAVPGQSHLLGDLAEAGFDPVVPLGDDFQHDGGRAGAVTQETVRAAMACPAAALDSPGAAAMSRNVPRCVYQHQYVSL
jgi:RNA polymerase sigma factor (sigma-70 family)